MESRRYYGLDIIRSFAIISLPILHGFMYSGFYSINSSECSMYIYIALCTIRWIVYCVVPLFIMLTGYLNETINFTKHYISKFIILLVSYVLISIFAVVCISLFYKQEIEIGGVIVALFQYTADPYGWYVEMYIGLWLLAPFLNVLWKNLNRNQHTLLICILALMSFFTQFNNVLRYQESTVKIVPSWWVGIYPLCYFCIGKWIKEYQPKWNKKILLICCAGLCVLQAFITGIRSTSTTGFDAGCLEGYCTINCAVISTLIFVTLYNINPNGRWKICFTRISKVSFEIMLFTYITDTVIWNNFNRRIYSNVLGGARLLGILVCIILSFLISYVMAEIFNWLRVTIVFKRRKNL